MQLDILTPEKKIFSGEASSVSLPGTEGHFQVLNNHAPLISSLKAGVIKYKTSAGETSFNAKEGFVEVLKNKVTVLVEGVETGA
ncbi:MAG: ATP synthase F1 subunit epsilon [Chitinophagales bacterium]